MLVSKIKLYILIFCDVGVVLNSLSSIISYSSYDYSSLLGYEDNSQDKDNEDKKKNNHQVFHRKSFIRQCAYTALVTMKYLILTVWSLYMISQNISNLQIVDTKGLPHNVPANFFYCILIFSWVCHLAACCLTVCYYNDHPASVSMNFWTKNRVWICGTEKELWILGKGKNVSKDIEERK